LQVVDQESFVVKTRAGVGFVLNYPGGSPRMAKTGSQPALPSNVRRLVFEKPVLHQLDPGDSGFDGDIKN
jgi:hypothetical protein